MLHFPSVSLVLGLAASALIPIAYSVPLWRRIAQDTPSSTQQWEKACLAAGGAVQCNPVSVAAFATLLAAAGPCAQQNSADAMIDLAKQLNNDPDMIRFAQIFAQQPRNTPDSLSVPYCQQAPRNAELNGLFQCQFVGANKQSFIGGSKLGDPGTIPFALNAPVSPLGSCPAHRDGPVPDGQQLVSITQNPGVGSVANRPNTSNAGGNSNNNGNGSSNSGGKAPTGSVRTGTNNNGNNSNTGNAGNAPSPAPASNSGFQLQNAKDAQALNAKFATLNSNSSCNDGENACVDGGFAQCVAGKFVVTPCSPGLICAALPLVNKPGTTITCTTSADALDRIQRTGAQGGLTG